MFLNVVVATKEQIEKIENKYFAEPTALLDHTKCTYDQEDEIYFIRIKHPELAAVMEFQMRSKPTFFSLTKGGTRYDVYYPDGKLLEHLRFIGEIAIKNWILGSEL